jgi:hypothetical protein
MTDLGSGIKPVYRTKNPQRWRLYQQFRQEAMLLGLTFFPFLRKLMYFLFSISCWEVCSELSSALPYSYYKKVSNDSGL